ncbi:heme-dependent oxidative N-demethylase family protein [Deinococcus altitudinis]|uniref:heme-dependent oxidative N-demethylase family protein n=1 Tax=Deinococcus altitudinis TaxID=468914 RepID=UPI003892215F
MLKLFPFGEAFDASMGGQVLRGDDSVFDLDLPHYLPEVRLKRRLLEDDHRYYFRGGAQTMQAQWEVLELVLRDLAVSAPEHFSLSQDGDRWNWHNRLLNERLTFRFGDGEGLPQEPLDWAGRQIQEDLVLMSADERSVFVGGQLCFANGWALDDRLGKSFAEIHTRTPQTTLPSVDAGQRLMGVLKAGRTVWRSSWNFKMTDELDLTTRHKARYKADFAARAPLLDAATVGPAVFVRIERQTFTRLPRSGLVLFGVHTYNSSLETEAQDPDRARRLVAVLRGTPEDVRLYKAITPIEGPMFAFLAARAAGAGA